MSGEHDPPEVVIDLTDLPLSELLRTASPVMAVSLERLRQEAELVSQPTTAALFESAF